jgi:hypothetical protein
MPSYLLTVVYGNIEVPITAINCVITSVGVVCQAPPGGCGVSNRLKITVGDYSTVKVSNDWTYGTSQVTAIVSSPLLHTDGSSSVVFVGTNLGTIGSGYCPISAVTYVGTSNIRHASTCQPFSYNGTLMICTTQPGTDINHKWTFTLGEVSTTGIPQTSYYAPIITMITPSGGVNTTGGEPFVVAGSEFGNSGIGLNVTIHLPPEFGGVATRTCTLITNYTTLACTTAPGVGGPWAVTITTPYQTSLPAYIYQYMPPTVSSITPQSPIATDSSTTFTLTGTNFGRYPAALSISLYQLNPYVTHSATHCTIPTNDVSM